MSRYPLLYQINTRTWLTELSRLQGRKLTLDDIPDAELDRLVAMGFEWIWFLSVWQTGAASQHVSRTNPGWRREFEETLEDLCDEDIPGSGFAISRYSVHRELGGDAALGRLRQRLHQRGLKLMLDFVPNHMGLDHHWIEDHPEYFVAGSELDLARAPHNYTWVKRQNGDLLMAYGRDPYFAGWPDTLQLNYGNEATQHAMLGEISRIAGQCDGVRCDMAMLVLPEVFERTWRIPCQPFWPKATQHVRDLHPGFCFMAEVYWDLEWELQQQGFDYTYDKRLYDRLRGNNARPIREHLSAGIDFQGKLARFLENHDEPRAAATFATGTHEAAAVITFLTPGLRFFHQGQLEGYKKRISPHLGRAPQEPSDESSQRFYQQLLKILRLPIVRNGSWELLSCLPAWDGNWTHDCVIAFLWQDGHQERLVVAVNYAENQSQCHVQLPIPNVEQTNWRLSDQLTGAQFDWAGGDIRARGLFVDLAPWQASIFSLSSRADAN